MLIRDDQGVAVIVGVEIQNCESVSQPKEDVVFLVVFRALRQLITKDATLGLLVTENVGQAPRRPESIQASLLEEGNT